MSCPPCVLDLIGKMEILKVRVRQKMWEQLYGKLVLYVHNSPHMGLVLGVSQYWCYWVQVEASTVKIRQVHAVRIAQYYT